LAPGPAPEKNRYIFLSRKSASHRSLLNEEEVFRTCRNFWPNMESLDLTDYSSSEQVDLFQSVRVVIGPHGQAFTNMIYTRDALAVIINPGSSVRGWSGAFRNLALQMGGEGLVLTTGTKDWHNKQNWSCDLDLLRGQLARLQELLPDKYR